ncbi:MAG: SPFH domain-containing protein [Solirubrobacteraceae bacterium]|nr:SPFH domain-containing protein [Solirubrobacteraceae bacterium]
MEPSTYIPIIAAAAAILVLFFIVWSMYKVAEPSEALIISGLLARGDNNAGESMDFKIISGRGTLVLPVLQTVRKLSLETMTITVGNANAHESLVSRQSVPVVVRGVVVFKVADDFTSIANASRRFLGQQDQMKVAVENIANGQLRSIVGSMTVEELISDREALRSQVLEACQSEMEKLGLHIDSFQLQSITDPTHGEEPGYIENLGRPQAAEVAKNARVAEAERLRDAVEKEQAAQAQMAESTRDSAVRQAQATAETEQANASAAQAGPLAEAKARQQVIQAETQAAQLEADLTEQRLQTQIRRPADAKAYEQVTLAQAAREAAVKAAEAKAREVELAAAAQAKATELSGEAQAKVTKVNGEAQANVVKVNGEASASATKLTGDAEASAVKARAMAEADGIQARNEALSTNSEAVIAQQIAERLPEIVAAAAKQYDNVEQLIVLDGAEGLSRGVAGTVGAAAALLPVAQRLIKGEGLGLTGNGSGHGSTNGAAPSSDDTPKKPVAKA